MSVFRAGFEQTRHIIVRVRLGTFLDKQCDESDPIAFMSTLLQGQQDPSAALSCCMLSPGCPGYCVWLYGTTIKHSPHVMFTFSLDPSTQHLFAVLRVKPDTMKSVVQFLQSARDLSYAYYFFNFLRPRQGSGSCPCT